MEPLKAAWFIDGSYVFKTWRSLHRPGKFNYTKLRQHLETTFHAAIEDAYYFDAGVESWTAGTNAFHTALSCPPPAGPGIRVKLYWTERKLLTWPEHWGGGPVVHPQNGQQFELRVQRAVDVGLTVHLMRSYANRKWRRLFLAAGDADFCEVVRNLVEVEDVELILIGTMDSISTELMPYARAVVKLDEIAEVVAVTQDGR